jgi:ubiquinone/menaquinone biosynthesis C-methylase UbiE
LTEEWDKKRETRRLNDSAANLYDERYTEEQKAKYSEALGSFKLEGLRSLLDAGCGTGLFIEYLGNANSEIFGLDTSIECLKIANGKLRNRENVFLICGDSDFMPFASSSFDGGVAFTLIQSIPNPLRTLEEIIRVLKRDAPLIISSLKKGTSLNRFEALLHSANLKLVKLVDGENLKDYIAICKN